MVVKPRERIYAYGYGYRFYNPGLGRWVNRDPIGEEGGVNLYVFINNGAIYLIDVSGRISYSPYPGTGVPYKPEDSIRTPGIGDHFRGGGNYLGEEKWFEKNYSGWLSEARKRFGKEINRWVENNCLSTDFQGPSSMINIYPSFDRGGSTSRQSPGGNERDYGDKGQSDWFADKVLGSFSIDYVTPVEISYEFLGEENGECCYKSSYTTEMYIEDVLGSQPGDLIRKIPGVGYLTPSRRVKRAKWNLTGSGKCCKSIGDI